MRVATWNVNSIRTRVTRVVDYLLIQDIDVLAMQEIKCRPSQFPYEAFEQAGYTVEAHGLNQWNGVAYASRLPMSDIQTGFDAMPGFGKPEVDGTLPLEARALGVTVEDVRLWNLYVPNGRELDHPHYAYKLEWLKELAGNVQGWLAADPDLPLALMGDWNVAPYDHDVWDLSVFEGSTHVSKPERDAFFAFEAAGLTDVVRPLVPNGFTYWDYKQLRWPRDEGMRIDFIMGSRAFQALVETARIDRDERDEKAGGKPSDHVPVVVDLAVETELDYDSPMIF